VLNLTGPPNKIYPEYTGILGTDGQEYTSRNGKVREVLNPVLEFLHPDFPFLFTHGRMLNLAFSMAEVIWILAGRNDVGLVDYFNSNIKNYSDDGKIFNAAYGYRMRHFGGDSETLSKGFDQLEDTILFLGKNPDTRHAAMTYRDPLMDGAIRETNDRACNLISHFLLRDKRLHMMQVIRSSDAIWGVPYNLIQWSHVLRYVAARLDVEVGYMTFHIHSGHIYEKHWGEVDRQHKWDPFEPYYRYKKFPLFENRMDTTNPRWLAQQLENMIFNDEMDTTHLTEFWKTYFQIFQAYKLWKEKEDEEAMLYTMHIIPWPYNVLLLKNFFTWRWSKPELAASNIQNQVLEHGASHSPGNWFYELVPHKIQKNRVVLDVNPGDIL